MSAVVTCSCGKSFRAKPELAGKRVKCPACGGVIQIPGAKPAAARAAAGGSTRGPGQPSARAPARASKPAPAPPPALAADDDPLGLGGFNEHAVGTPLPQTGTLPQTRRPARRRQKSQVPWGPILKIGLIAGGILFGIVLLAVAAVVAWKFLGPASPDAVFAKATGALEREDWKAFFDCVTPEGQDQIAGAMLGMAAMAARGGSRVPADKQEKVQQLTAILEQHGIDQETLEGMPVGFELLSTARNPEKMKPYLAPIRNRSAFIADMIDVLQEIGDREMPTPPLIDAHLEDVKIDGDTATAVAVGTKDGRERRDKIRFRKVGGSWKIAPDSLGRL